MLFWEQFPYAFCDVHADEPDLVHGPPLYLVLISLHGLVRGHEMELGRDADTGGQVRQTCVVLADAAMPDNCAACLSHSQVKYVVELSRALAKHPGVHRVDLLTRLITGT
jgi:sucrose-phosphate synthase